jgi:mRNA-degrading endonuclease YafQ of YafQ-DinJ toxin-antitoxin module
MKVGLHRRFIKKFKKLPKSVRLKFVERKNLFVEDKFNPVLNNHSVGKAFPGCRSIDITGDYRVIFEDGGDVATFLKIGTHSELYG